MTFTALELDDKDMMVIRLLFFKREIISETIFWIAVARNRVLNERKTFVRLLECHVISLSTLYLYFAYSRKFFHIYCFLMLGKEL